MHTQNKNETDEFDGDTYSPIELNEELESGYVCISHLAFCVAREH